MEVSGVGNVRRQKRRVSLNPDLGGGEAVWQGGLEMWRHTSDFSVEAHPAGDWSLCRGFY
jgi:hypothetical protein